MSALEAILTKLDSDRSNLIVSSFRRMRIAEEEISAAKRRFPKRAHARVHNAFVLLCPPPIIQDRGDALYRMHCRELIARAAHGHPNAEATDAETLAVLLVTSLRAPLTGRAQAAAEMLFAKLFPEKSLEILSGGPQRESWEGSTEEVIREARRAAISVR